MSIDPTRRAARKIHGADASTAWPAVVRTTGTVTAVAADGTVTVTIRANPNPIAGVETDSNYVGAVGDNVHIELVDGIARVTGKTGSSPAAFGGARAATVATSETRATNTYGDLATVGPFVTVTVGSSGMVEVGVGAKLAPASGSDGAVMSYAFSGAATIAASDAWCVSLDQVSGTVTAGRTYLHGPLTPGTYTITAKYRSTAGAAAGFSNRHLWAQPR